MNFLVSSHFRDFLSYVLPSSSSDGRLGDGRSSDGRLGVGRLGDVFPRLITERQRMYSEYACSCGPTGLHLPRHICTKWCRSGLSGDLLPVSKLL